MGLFDKIKNAFNGSDDNLDEIKFEGIRIHAGKLTIKKQQEALKEISTDCIGLKFSKFEKDVKKIMEIVDSVKNVKDMDKMKEVQEKIKAIIDTALKGNNPE